MCLAILLKVVISVNQKSLVSCLVLWLAWFVGCGSDLPPLGNVSGKVTMDGEPLAGVIINFKPEDGRMATGTTDKDGRYTLEYVYGAEGTKVGKSTVMFEWPLGKGGKPIPKRYTGLDSELKVEVADGRNEFNFDLESKPSAPKK